MTQLRALSTSEVLLAPSFSHEKKDPVPNDVSILPHHRIIILEGLYANLDEGDFAIAARQYDERWVVQGAESVLKARLIKRHLATGVSRDVEEAEWRGEKSVGKGRQLLLLRATLSS